MALLSALVKAIADVEGIDEVHVGWVARHLREAGLITQAGRGRGAAHMSNADATNLLIGVNAATSAKEGSASVQAYRSLPCGKANLRRSGIIEMAFHKGISFGESLEILVELAKSKDNRPVPLEEELFGLSRYFGEVEKDEFQQLLVINRSKIHEIIHSEITFNRPYRHVSILVQDLLMHDMKGNPIVADDDTVAEIDFWDHKSKWPIDGDRDERVRITFKTILAVGSTLSI